ncbi:MAG: hypothetical protein K2H23_02040 [Oscillospiraceae bacterium]|nr:hypothetical protein [Oscillospiraceae bacterium]
MTAITARFDKCKDFLLDIVFPNRCPLCGCFIRWDCCICEKCREYIRANDVICRKCGEYPCVCEKSEFEYDMAFGSFFFGDENVSSAIYRFKNTGEENIARAAAEDFAARLKTEGIPKPDLAVPVPMGKRKLRRRGHNQAELFARCIGKCINIPVRNDILYKYDTKDEQHFHSAKERRERVRKLFYTKCADLSGMTVVICDDVMTTGSTVNECAMLLKTLGAERVISAVCAVTQLDSKKEGHKIISEEDV